MDHNAVNDRALVLAAFGTSTVARDTYDFFDDLARRRFPQHDIFWAFSSQMLREAMASRQMTMESPDEVLNRLRHTGYRQIVLQSLHVVLGFEFKKLAAAARTHGSLVSLGRPLLADEADCRRTIEALAERIPDTHDRITVLVGHGSTYAEAAATYVQFDRLLAGRFPSHAHLCMVEGEPSWESIRGKIITSGIKKIRFIPLMFVAGEHMLSDVLGDQETSWIRQLPGWEIDGTERGLGWNEKVAKIYLDHAADAMSAFAP